MDPSLVGGVVGIVGAVAGGGYVYLIRRLRRLERAVEQLGKFVVIRERGYVARDDYLGKPISSSEADL